MWSQVEQERWRTIEAPALGVASHVPNNGLFQDGPVLHQNDEVLVRQGVMWTDLFLFNGRWFMAILWSFWNRKRITATIKPLVLAVAFWDMFQAADANFFTSVPGWGRSNDRFKKDADLLMLEVILETWQPLKTWQCMGHSLSPTEQIRMSMFRF